MKGLLTAAAAGMSGRGRRRGGFQLNGPVIILVIVGIAVIFFIKPIADAFKGVLEGLGLRDSEEDKNVEAAINNASNKDSCWNSNFYKAIPNGRLLTVSTADAYCKRIWDAFGPFDDSEDDVVGVFKQMKSQTQVSFLVERFYVKYSVDLLAWLQGGIWPNDRLSNDDINIILSNVKSLPKA